MKSNIKGKNYVFIIIFLLLNPVLIKGQNFTDSLGYKQGKWMFFSEFDSLIREEAYTFCTYVNGVTEGSLRVVDSREIVRYEVQMINGKRSGVGNLYDKNQRILASFFYDKGELRTIIQYTKRVKLYEIIEMKNGKYHGSKITFWNNGKIWIQESYENGKLNGSLKHFYRNGNVKIDELYINDRLVEIKIYNRNRKLKFKKEIL